MYMLGTFSTPHVVPKWVEARVLLLTCLLGLSLSVLLVGPTFTELNLPVMIVGLFISGAFLGPLMIPNMAEMMRSVALVYPEYDLESANSLMSGMLNGCYGIGQASGPLLGALLFQICGFRSMCDFVSAFVFCFFLLYIACAQGCQAFSQTYSNFHSRNC